MQYSSVSIAILFAVSGIVLWRLLAGRGALRGSTLIAPWVWMIVTIGGLAGGELLIFFHANGVNSLWSDAVRYIAAMLTFTPGMAVLGAKRPQDRGWQWVVLTLWLVLSMPAMQAYVYGIGPRVEPFLAWRILVVMLLFLEVLNYIVSRFRWAALLFAAAQIVLFWPHLISDSPSQTGYTVAAVLIIAVAMLLVRASRRTGITDDPCTAIWQRFVNEYGSMWSFRVMGLLNQSSATAKWPVRLMPFGFINAVSGESVRIIDQSTETQREVRAALRNTLRRFYSPDMLASLDSDAG